MHVVINGQLLLTDKFKFTGPEVYTKNLVSHLASIDTENTYTIYVTTRYDDNKAHKSYEYKNKIFKELTNNNPNFKLKIIKDTISWTHFGVVKELFKDKPDVYFTAVHTIPFIKPNHTKVVSMIHGLEYKYIPEYKNWFKRAFQVLSLWYAIKFSKKIITPSNATKNALIKKFGNNKKDKIQVIPEGVGNNFYRRSNEEILEIKEKYKLNNTNYLLFVSTIQPRKNITRMVEAFSLALKELKGENLKLCISGKLGWLYEESVNAPKTFGIEDKVIFLGRTPDDDLPTLLSGAIAFVNLSLEEGFGLPVLEAEACGTPCILSRIEAFTELASNCAIFTKPNNIREIKEAMISIVKNESLRQDLAEKGKLNAKKYSWEKTSKETLNVFESVAKNS